MLEVKRADRCQRTCPRCSTNAIVLDTLAVSLAYLLRLNSLGKRAHQNMASKFFCCCCESSEGPPNTVHPYDAAMSQENHPRTFDLNTSPHRNGGQKRCPHPNNTMMKACTIGRP
ncbi:testis-expressed protein 53 [Eptesicus fuscus]|uniref:testis-expressed protein 53 n=1 Tax=Eptesicus fuscus TaxID=29078 RepID=UPI002403D850|nr:testis-expressed protein 53 [Eptesicus fuscus]